MSVWTIERAGGHVKLTYTHEPFAAQPLVQPCGEADTALEADLEAWVFDQAAPWDLVHTPRGTFVRLNPVGPERSVSEKSPSDPVDTPAASA